MTLEFLLMSQQGWGDCAIWKDVAYDTVRFDLRLVPSVGYANAEESRAKMLSGKTYGRQAHPSQDVAKDSSSSCP